MRLRDVVNGLTIPPTLTARTVANMSRFPVWWFNKLTTGGLTFASLTGAVEGNPTPGEVASMMFDPGLDLAALDWLRDRWKGKLLVKGVTTPSAAEEIMERGADGVVVSNHGGRQLDRSAATLDVLPAIRATVGERATVLVDGGVRHGQDVLAARALGADAAMIGRAYLYGLMAGGQAGVLRAYEIWPRSTSGRCSCWASAGAPTSPSGTSPSRRTGRATTRTSRCEHGPVPSGGLRLPTGEHAWQEETASVVTQRTEEMTWSRSDPPAAVHRPW
jgi:hypothetical protein